MSGYNWTGQAIVNGNGVYGLVDAGIRIDTKNHPY